MGRQKINVIGAGLGGLAASCLLAKKGYNVTIFEKNSSPGGKISEYKKQGYRFDTGPSLLTMPFILESLFKQCGAEIETHLKLKPLEPICRYFFKEGYHFDCYKNQQENLDQIEDIAPQDREAYRQFMEYSAKLYDRTKEAYLYNPLYSINDMFSVNILDFFRIDAFQTVAGRIDQSFRSPLLRKFFKRFTTYNGSSPYQAPATLNVIPHVELNMGGYYISGGMYRLVESLVTLAEKLGVEIRYNQHIKKIDTENGAAAAVINSRGNRFKSDITIGNSDASETYLKLISHNKIPKTKLKRIKSLEPSCSGFVMLLGVDKKFEQLKHHNIFFGSDYKTEFKQIFKDKIMPEDPTIYIADTSSSDPDHAPENCSNLFILVNAPYMTDHVDWQKQKHEYGQKIINKLEKRGLNSLKDSIQVQEYLTPFDFQKKYLSNKGSIYGTSSNSRFSAFMRPKNKSREIKNLYLVGGSTHPGGGIPLVILSAFHAAELIKRFE